MSPAGAMLAIETSQRLGSVAVRGPAGPVLVEPLRQSARHDDDLLPAIDRLMGRAALKPRDLVAVAVSIGPGGFTGLRIAVATAKMLALALSVRLVAVPSALVAARRAGHDRDITGRIIVALAAKRSTTWCTPLRRSGDAWEPAGAPGLVEAADLDLDGIALVLADKHLPEPARLRCARRDVPIVEPTFDAAACLAVAEDMLTRGDTVEASALLPLYPRPPEAVTLWAAKRRD